MPSPCLQQPANSPEDLEPTEPPESAVAVVVGATTGEPRVWPVAALNPEAGDHVITADPRELRAAFRAGEQTRRRFVYYEQRYGERGLRFTRSDSAWIVTRAVEAPGATERQLRWLGAVLAARGMPRWLLEVHLEALHAELVVAVPEKVAAYDALLGVSSAFRGERLSHLDPELSLELAQAFDQRVGPAAVAGLPEAGALLVAAVADERAGVGGAVESLLGWLADPARWPDEWVAAALETVSTARELARG